MPFKALLFLTYIFTLVSVPVMLSAQGDWGRHSAGNTALPSRLPCNYVTGFFTDTADRLWVATQCGAAVFDGGGFEQAPLSDSLPSQTVYGGLMLDDGQMWLATAKGPYRYEGTDWSRKGLPDKAVKSMAKDTAGSIWLSYQRGLTSVSQIYIYDGSTFEYLSVHDGFLSGNPECFEPDSSGNIWIGSILGLERYDGATISSWGAPDGMCSDEVYSLLHINTDSMLIGNAGGLSVFDGSTFVSYGQAEGLNCSRVTDLARGQGDTYWLATDSGLYRFDGTDFYPTMPDSGMPSAQITAVYCDDSGAVWAGTEMNGLFRYYNGNWDVFTSGGMANNSLTTLFVDKRNQLWAGCRGAVSLLDSTGKWHIFQRPQVLCGNTITGIAQDGGGAIWVSSTDSGIVRNMNGQWAYYNVDSGMLAGPVSALCADSTGTIWMGGPQGISKWDNVSISTEATAAGLPLSNCYKLYTDRTGQVWAACDTGLFVWDGSSYSLYTTADGLPGSNLITMYQEKDGTYWFSFEANGIYFLEGGSFVKANYNNVISSVFIESFYQDSRERMWIGTHQIGVFMQFRDTFLNYTQLDGMVSSYGIMDIDEDEQGNMLFATLYGGLQVLSPHDMLIAQIEHSARSCPGDTGAYIYIDAEGIGTPWTYSIDKGKTWQVSAEFTSLPAGKYYPMVRSANDTAVADSVIILGKPDMPVFADSIAISCTESAKLKTDHEYEKYYWSTGDTSQSIHADQNGLYALTVTDADKCTQSDTIEVMFLKSSAVHVQIDTSVLNGQGEGQLVLYNYIEGRQMIEHARAAIGSDGMATLPSVAEGSYLMQAIVPENSLGYTDTYYPSHWYWDSAQVVDIGCYLEPVQFTMPLLKGGIESVSSSFVSGKVYANETFSKENARLVLVDRSDLSVERMMRADSIDGSFMFEHLLPGAYYLYCDVPGLPLEDIYELVIKSSTQSFINHDFYVGGDIIFLGNEDLEVESVSKLSLVLCPNPVIDRISIKGLGKEQKYTLTILDARGWAVMQLAVPFGAGALEVDMASLSPGYYTLVAIGENEYAVAGFIKQ